ncbi:unnamed protein product [Leptosia nina]|uniref:3'-5' exonuclease domain-containing protein n=1 Tax=Leptosia nina TaxID=320188 RepID=A0AAV1JSU4_9NEOP
MDNRYMKGELLQLQTKNSEIIEGRFFSMTSDMSKISLYNVKESAGDEKSDGVFHYYDSEVRDIIKVKESTEPTFLKISQKECEDILLVSKKYKYINQVDSSFHEAIETLKQFGFLALSSDGAHMGRKCKMPFLVLSTPHQIFIFDIQVMQYHAFDAGLKEILEDNDIKKIVHGCRKLSDCLYHKHNIKLKSVFDTQVADLIITKNKTGRLPESIKSLAQCIHTFLGLKEDIIDEKLDIVQCTVRPLPVNIKESLAKNIAFLHRLSEVLHDKMMLPFVRGVEFFIENVRSCDDFKAWELCGKYNQVPKDFKNAIEY